MCRRSRRHLPPTPFRRGVFAAWGPRKGYKTTSYSLTEAAKRTAAKGYEWVALILDDSGQDEDSRLTAEYNRSIYQQWMDANRNEGVLAGGWVTQGGNLYLVPSDSDLAIAEIEGPGDYFGVANIISGLGAGPLPTCPLGTVTNFSTLTRDMCKLLIDAGFTCLPEAYMNENPNMTPYRMDLTARYLGWPTSQPVAGVYPVAGMPAPSYAEWADWPLADYLLEAVI